MSALVRGSVVSWALAGLSACAISEDFGEDFGAESQEVAVTWANAVGVTVSGADLTKTAAAGWGNAGASSATSVSGDAFVEFTTNERTTGKILGLSSDDSNQDYRDIDFALHPSGNGTFYVYEAGKNVGNFGAYNAGDVFRVETVERVVRYFRNGVLVSTSTQVPTRPLLVDAALFHTGATLIAANLTDFRFRSTVGVQLNGNTLTKTVGLADAWNNSGAIGVRTIKADTGHIEFTSTNTTHGKIAGLSNVDTNQHFNTIRFGLLLPRHASTSGKAQVIENGLARFTDTVNWLTTDVFRVAVVVDAAGVSRVQYLKNGVVLFTSALAVTYPLIADTAFFHDGGNLTLTVNDTFWSSVVGAEAIGSKLVADVSGAGNAGAFSDRSIAAGAGFVEFTTNETTRSKALGLNSVNTSANVTDIDHAIELGANGAVVVRENGVSRGGFGTYVAGQKFRVEVATVGGVLTVQYKRDGVTFFTSTVAPTFPLFADAALSSAGATVTNVTIVDLP